MKFDAPTVGGASGRWFEAASAIEVIRAIKEHIAGNRDEVEDAATVVDQLETLETILSAARDNGVRFRLSLDY